MNSHEFRSVLPAVARAIEKNKNKPIESKWNRYARKNPRFILYLAAVLLGLVALIFAGVFILVSFLFTSFFFSIFHFLDTSSSY